MASGGKCIGRIAIDDVQPGRRKISGRAYLTDELMKLGRLCLRCFPGPVGSKNDFVGMPVRDEVYERRNSKRQQEPDLPSEKIAAHENDAAHCCQQNRGLYRVLQSLVLQIAIGAVYLGRKSNYT